MGVSCLLGCSMDEMMKEVKMQMGMRRVSFLEYGREWKLPGFLNTDKLVVCGESEDLRAVVGRFTEVY